MGMIKGVQRQLRSVIEWNNVQPNDLIHHWSDNGDEIKSASKLIIAPGQGCVFVYQGKIRAVLSKEGLYPLETANIPFWTTIQKVLQFFQSEHKVGLFFYRATRLVDQKWGTPSPIKYDDPKYRFPVGLRAFGNYTVRIKDPRLFFTSVLGANQDFSIDELRALLNGRMVPQLADFLAESAFSYAEIDANRNEIALQVLPKLNHLAKNLGFELTDFRIEGTHFDPDTEARIHSIANKIADQRAAEAIGLSYKESQQIDAMRDAAKNEGGGAGVGMGIGAGMEFGKLMGQEMQSDSSQGTQGKKEANAEEKLAQLKALFEKELITQSEYDKKRADILSQL